MHAAPEFPPRAFFEARPQTCSVLACAVVESALDHWTISCLLSCVALAAIVLTLALHAGRSMPQWPNLISINSLVAIFTAIMKAALLLPVTEGVIISHVAVKAKVPRPNLCFVLTEYLGISQLKWLSFDNPRPLINLEHFDAASHGPWGSFLMLYRAHKERAYS